MSYCIFKKKSKIRKIKQFKHEINRTKMKQLYTMRLIVVFIQKSFQLASV